MKHSILRGRRRWAALGALLLAATLGAAGCARNKHVINIDYRYSMNVWPVEPWYPDPKATPLRPAEQAVFDQRGRPDYIRFWWRPDGALITTSDLSRDRSRIGEKLGQIRQSWIFLDLTRTEGQEEGKEIVFNNAGTSYREQPLDELIALVCRYGDPNERKPPVMRNGQRHETWLWIEHGIQLHLVDGKVFERKAFQATGSGTYLLK